MTARRKPKLALRRAVQVQDRVSRYGTRIYRVPRFYLIEGERASTISRAVYMALKRHGLPLERA